MKPTQEARLLAALDHERTWREMLQEKLAVMEQARQQLVAARLQSAREQQASARTSKICLALQERLLELEAALRQTEQQRAAESEAAVDRLTRRHAEFTASLAEGARARDTLARRLDLARATLEQVRQARQADGIAANEALRRHQAEFEGTLAAATAARAAVEQQLESLRADIQQAEANHASERAADADLVLAAHEAVVAARVAQLSDQRDALHNQFEEAVAQAAATRAAYERQLSDAAVALDRAQEHRAADAVAAAQHLESLQADIRQAEARHASERAADAERRAAHDAAVAANLAQISEQRNALTRKLSASSAALETSQKQRALEAADARATLEQTVAQAAATRQAFERQLSDAAVALERAEEHRAADAVAAAQHLEERQAEFEGTLAAAAAARGAVEQQLENLQADVQRAEAHQAYERAAEAERRTAHDAAVAANLAQISEQRDALATQLNASLAALEASQKQLALEGAAVERLTLREAELLGQLSQETDNRATLERRMEQAARTRREADERYALELSAAASQRHALQRQFEEAVAQAATTREAFERQLSDAAAALEQAEEHRAADMVAAAQGLVEREAELGTIITDGAATRIVLEARLDEVQLALKHAEQLAEAERVSASAREQSIQDDLGREVDLRTSVEHDLGAARAEFARARRRLLTAASALRRRTAERRTLREAHFAQEQSDHERRLGAREETIRQVEAERDTLRQSLDAVRGELQALSDSYDNERIEFERTQSSNEAKLQGLTAEYDMARHSLDHLRAAFNTLERVWSEHAIERARLEGVVIDRDARIGAQEAAHLSADQAGKEALRQAEDRLRQAVAHKNNQIGGLERELESLRQDMERARLAGEAENWQQFEHAPHAMCRLTRDGALIATNQAFARVLGYRSTDDLGKPDLATAVFETPADLQWLIERAAGGGALATIETVWKKKDRTPLSVRLQVVRTKEEWLEVAAEDITLLRTTEENLRQARRMEAVGRLASEVAVTCDTLLRGVSHGGQYWLAAIGGDLGLRRQGEQLLGDVAHATSLLQRLAAYSNEQTDALQPVNLQRVLRNLEPVLKRVAGDEIEVVLPKHIRPFSVDVERTRVERVLVNVASYARERMPNGGRLKIDLAAAVVDRTFLDKYPNVRPGPHVIATVTEERRTTLTGLPVPWPAPSADDSTTSAGEKPGVDLSALLQLLGDCGGHLWVTAEPPGNMTLKIHLPLSAPDDATSPAGWFARAGGGRALGRWSRH